MDRDEILSLLTELAERLERRDVRGELLLVGGAAMALAYSSRRSTTDLDAVFEPKQVIYDVAKEIADERELPEKWLNDAVKGFLPGPDPNATVFLEHDGLVVRVASPRYLLAMKLLASRVERDEDDIALLLRLSGVTTAEDALSLVERYYAHRAVPPKVEFLVRELLADLGQARPIGPWPEFLARWQK